MKHLYSLALVLTLLGGCAGSPVPPSEAVPVDTLSFAPDEAHEVATLLARHERLTTEKTDEQRREYNAALAAFERAPSDSTRLNLALTMLLPRVPWRDDGRVLNLLAGIEAVPRDRHSPRHDLAQMLLRLMRALREDQRKAEQAASLLILEERRKNEEMQQKIESLRAIDKDMRMKRKTP
jgi:hypothetical protein